MRRNRFASRLPEAENYVVDLHYPRLEARFESLLHGETPDVVHLHHWFNLGLGLVWMSHSLGIQVVVSLHDVWTTCPRFFRVVDEVFCTKDHGLSTCGPCISSEYTCSEEALHSDPLIRDLLIRRELASAVRLLAPSVALRDFIPTMLPGTPPIHVLPHGLLSKVPRLDYLLPDPKANTNAKAPLRVGTGGSLVREKGIHVLLQALHEVAENLAFSVELHVWGQCLDPAYARSLEEQDDAGIPHLQGAYGPQQLQEMASQLHLAVFPSICFESYGLALDEALSTGIPVVVEGQVAHPVQTVLHRPAPSHQGPEVFGLQLSRATSAGDTVDHLGSRFAAVKAAGLALEPEDDIRVGESPDSRRVHRSDRSCVSRFQPWPLSRVGA